MSSNFDEVDPHIDIRPYELGESLPEFDCGKPWFNEFINENEIEEYHRKRLGRTWLVYFDGEFGGYYSLSPNSMREADYDEDRAVGGGELYDGPFDMPARLLGHLAVDEEFKGQGIGEYLVKRIIARTEDIDTPYRLLILHSHDDTISYYQQYGFAIALPGDEEEGTTLMFYDIGTLP